MSDKFFEYAIKATMIICGLFIIFAIAAMIYEYLNPPVYIKIPANEWTCTAEHTVMVGKLVHEECDQYSRLVN